jgi:hypothetical protein
MRVKTLEELKDLFAAYEEVVSRASDIAELPSGTSVDYIEYDGANGMIDVYGTSVCRGECCHEEDRFPIEWLIMSDEQVKEVKAEKKRAELLAKQEREREAAERVAREQEEKDRAEYERLKLKFESQDVKEG